MNPNKAAISPYRRNITSAVLGVLLLIPGSASCQRKADADTRVQKTSGPTDRSARAIRGDQLLASKESAEEVSCQQFVQQFYDGYVFHLLENECEHLRDRKEQDLNHSCKHAKMLHPGSISVDQALDTNLKKLRAEEESIKRRESDPGLDFDEILNSQDPSSRFLVVQVQSRDGHCHVVVDGMDGDVKREEVMPELLYDKASWRIVNFHYRFDAGNGNSPKEDDLVHMLKSYIEKMSKYIQ